MHRSPRRTSGRALLVSTLAVLLIAGCGEQASDGAGGDTTTGSPGAAPSSTSSSTAGAAIPPEPLPGTVVEAVVRAGAVEGGSQEASVPLGEEVILRVTSDVADEVHVHGYDLYVDVTPGEVAELRFVADLPGVWEVELEEAGLHLVALRVA